MLNPGVEYDLIESIINDELNKLIVDNLCNDELQKVKNKVESTDAFGKTTILNKAMGLAISSLIDTPNLINTDLDNYLKVTPSDIKRVAKNLFDKNNRSTLYYKSNQQ